MTHTHAHVSRTLCVYLCLLKIFYAFKLWFFNRRVIVCHLIARLWARTQFQVSNTHSHTYISHIYIYTYTCLSRSCTLPSSSKELRACGARSVRLAQLHTFTVQTCCWVLIVIIMFMLHTRVCRNVPCYDYTYSMLCLSRFAYVYCLIHGNLSYLHWSQHNTLAIYYAMLEYLCVNKPLQF